MPTNGFVYVFLRADGLRKLGWTKHLTRRRTTLSRVNGVSHAIEMSWEMADCSAYQVEQQAHFSLRAHHVALDREVYALPLADIVKAVEAAIAQTEKDLFFPDRTPRSKIRFLHKTPEWPKLLAEANAELEANPALFEAIMASQAEARKRLAQYGHDEG